MIKVLTHEFRTNMYFLFSVDSTLDISHVEQLSFIIGSINHYDHPTENFPDFTKNREYKAELLFHAVTRILEKHDIQNCRGLSNDNASNMLGHYLSLQVRIKVVKKLVVYIPCSAHSLSLVGICRA